MPLRQEGDGVSILSQVCLRPARAHRPTAPTPAQPRRSPHAPELPTVPLQALPWALPGELKRSVPPKPPFLSLQVLVDFMFLEPPKSQS